MIKQLKLPEIIQIIVVKSFGNVTVAKDNLRFMNPIKRKFNIKKFISFFNLNSYEIIYLEIRQIKSFFP